MNLVYLRTLEEKQVILIALRIHFHSFYFSFTLLPWCELSPPSPLRPSTSQIRDDNKRQHPCLVDFAKLPETERNYNLQMSSETLK